MLDQFEVGGIHSLEHGLGAIAQGLFNGQDMAQICCCCRFGNFSVGRGHVVMKAKAVSREHPFLGSLCISVGLILFPFDGTILSRTWGVVGPSAAVSEVGYPHKVGLR